MNKTLSTRDYNMLTTGYILCMTDTVLDSILDKSKLSEEEYSKIRVAVAKSIIDSNFKENK